MLSVYREAALAAVCDAGLLSKRRHVLHHDQPSATVLRVRTFLPDVLYQSTTGMRDCAVLPRDAIAIATTILSVFPSVCLSGDFVITCRQTFFHHVVALTFIAYQRHVCTV